MAQPSAGYARNLIVRSFLREVGKVPNEPYFDHSSKKGKKVWDRIKKRFNQKCAYCGKRDDELEMEHLIMLNRQQGGLHHPGNVVPACKECNKREKDDANERYLDWEKHLNNIKKSDRGSNIDVATQINNIKDHMKCENYPYIGEVTQKSIIKLAECLYKEVMVLQEGYIKKAEELSKTIHVE